MRARVPRITICAVAATMLGCEPRNASIGLIGDGPIPTLAAAAPSKPPEAEPSLRGLDRSHWPTLVVSVPAHQVEHSPAFRAGVLFPSRFSAPFPTAANALNTDAGFPWSPGPRGGDRFTRAPQSAASGITGLRLDQPAKSASPQEE